MIASLPCYLESNCDAQRGDGVFQKSIAAIQRLNELGYAQPGTGLELHLVYNPTGLGLPPSQAKLEDDYRRHLSQHYGIAFSKLYTITNMPIIALVVRLDMDRVAREASLPKRDEQETTCYSFCAIS